MMMGIERVKLRYRQMPSRAMGSASGGFAFFGPDACDGQDKRLMGAGVNIAKSI